MTPTIAPAARRSIAEIRMIDATNGWAWSNGVEGQYLLLRTTDGGQTWRDVTPRAFPYLEGGGWFGSHVDVVSLKDVFVRGGPNLYVTHDGARSWRTIKPNLDLGLECSKWDVSRMDFVDATHGWIVISDNRTFAPFGNYPLFKTSDGGSTWTELPLKIVP